MSDRKLAKLVAIDSLEPIAKADRLELARVGGWQSVVQKGEFQVGQEVVYIEVDAWIPTSVAPFLTRPGHTPKIYKGIQGERLKTIKLRGVLSQGLILPVDQVRSIVKEKPELEGGFIDDILGITKWEREQGGGNVLGSSNGRNWPYFLQKTDQERIQNCFNDMTHVSNAVLAHGLWEVTEKLDGSSMTVYCKAIEGGFSVGVCSRNIDLEQAEGNRFWEVALALDLPKKLEQYCRDEDLELAVQGELIGPGIQGNKHGLDQYKFVVFDIYDIRNRSYLHASLRRSITKDLGLQHTPVLGNHRLAEFKTVQEVLAFAEGKMTYTDNEREGVVFKNLLLPNVSFKAISNKFLLKNDD